MKPRRSRQTLTAAQVLAEGQSSLGSRIAQSQRLFAAWEQAVGKEWSTRATPLRLDRDTLIVAVSESIWIQEFNFMAHTILARLREALPEVYVQKLRCEYAPPVAPPRPVQRRKDMGD